MRAPLSRAPRKATLSGSVLVGSGICGTRSGGEEITCGAGACGAGVMNHTIRASATMQLQSQVMMRAEAGTTACLSLEMQGTHGRRAVDAVYHFQADSRNYTGGPYGAWPGYWWLHFSLRPGLVLFDR